MEDTSQGIRSGAQADASTINQMRSGRLTFLLLAIFAIVLLWQRETMDRWTSEDGVAVNQSVATIRSRFRARREVQELPAESPPDSRDDSPSVPVRRPLFTIGGDPVFTQFPEFSELSDVELFEKLIKTNRTPGWTRPFGVGAGSSVGNLEALEFELALRERGDRIVPMLLARLEDDDERTRRWSAVLLRVAGERRAGDAITALLRAMANTQHPEVPHTIAVLAWNRPETLEALRSMVLDESLPIQPRAGALTTLLYLFEIWNSGWGLETRPVVAAAIEIAQRTLRESLRLDALWAQPPVIPVLRGLCSIVASYVPDLDRRVLVLIVIGLKSRDAGVREAAALFSTDFYSLSAFDRKEREALLDALKEAQSDDVSAVREAAKYALRNVSL